MASIHPRTNKDGSITHRVLFRIDGRQAQESFSTPIAAERFKASVERVGGREARQILIDAEEAAEPLPTLTAWVAEYLDPESGLLSGVTDGTRDGYRRIAERSFLIRLGDLPIDHISEKSVRAWINWQTEQKTYRGGSMSAKTIKNYHALLSGALACAVSEKLIDRNVAHGVPLPKGSRPLLEILTESEFALVFKNCLSRYQTLMLTLASTGMRFGEATALLWEDVRQINGVWCFDVNKAWKEGAGSRRTLGAPKSEAGSRLISVTEDVIQALGPRRGPKDLVFVAAGGGAISNSSFTKFGLQRAVRLSGVRKSLRNHDLRHSHASWLIARGVPLPYIQKRLGHEKIETTIKVYGHLLPEALTATRDAAGEAIKLALAT